MVPRGNPARFPGSRGKVPVILVPVLVVGTALLAEARQAEQLASLIGLEALSVTEQRYLDLARLFDTEVLDQPPDDPRSIDDTLDRLWRVAAVLPPRELTVVSADQRAAHLRPTVAASEASVAEHDGAAP